MDLHRLADALPVMAAAMAHLSDGAAQLTCREVESIAEVLRAAGHVDAADSLIDAHAYGDDDDSDTHHGAYLQQLVASAQRQLASARGIADMPAVMLDRYAAELVARRTDRDRYLSDTDTADAR